MTNTISKPNDIFESYVIDYLGNITFVSAHESNALYPVGRWLGETSKLTNHFSVQFLQEEYNKKVDTNMRYLEYKNNTLTVKREKDEGGAEVIMEVKNVI